MGSVAPDLNVKALQNVQGVCEINDVFSINERNKKFDLKIVFL